MCHKFFIYMKYLVILQVNFRLLMNGYVLVYVKEEYHENKLSSLVDYLSLC